MPNKGGSMSSFLKYWFGESGNFKYIKTRVTKSRDESPKHRMHKIAYYNVQCTRASNYYPMCRT